MEEEKKPPKDNKQHYKPKTDDKVLKYQDERDNKIELIQQISGEDHQAPENTSIAQDSHTNTAVKDVGILDAENIQSSPIEDKNDQEVQTELTINSKAKVTLIQETNESHTNPEASGMIRIISYESSDLPGSDQQNDTLKSISQLGDDSINDNTSVKELEEVKCYLLNIVKSIEENLQNSDKSAQISDISTNRLEIPDGENTGRHQPADTTKPDLTSAPSTSYGIPGEEETGSNQKEVSLTSYLDFTPLSGPDEIPSADRCIFKAVEQEDATPMNKDIKPEAKKILMFSSESQKDEERITKRYFFRTKGEKEDEDPTPLITNVWPKRKSLDNLFKKDGTTSSEDLKADNSQNSENIPVKHDSVWTIDTTLSENQDNTLTSQSTQFVLDEAQDADRTGSSVYQSAIDDPDNTNSLESVSSDILNDSTCSTQEFEDLQVTINAAAEDTQTELESSDQDTSQLDYSDSITVLYDPNRTYPFRDVKEDPFPKTFLFDRPDKKKQETDLPKKESELHSEIDDDMKEQILDENKAVVLLPKTSIYTDKPDENKTAVVLPTTSIIENKPTENKTAVLLPPTSIIENKPDENKAGVLLPKISTYENKPHENKAEDFLPKTSIFEVKPNENKAVVLLPKTSTYEGKLDKNKAEILLPKTSIYENQPDENKAEDLLPKTSIFEVKPDENKTVVLLPKTSTYEGKLDENKAEVLLPKTSIYEIKPDEKKAEVLLPKTSTYEHKLDENKADMEKKKLLLSIPELNESEDQKLLMQFPIDWSTLSDFNLTNVEGRNIVHSTPYKEISVQEKLSSTPQPEHSKGDKSKSPAKLQKEQTSEKKIPESKSSSPSIEELSDEDTKFPMDKTGTQVDWFWLPANKVDFFLPSACCYEILPGEDTHSDSSSRVDESEKETVRSNTKTIKASETSSKEDLQMASGDPPTEQNKTFDRPGTDHNVTFDRPGPALNETFVREGPELHKEVYEVEDEFNKTFVKPLPASKQQVPEISPGPSSQPMNVTFIKSDPVELKPIPVKEYQNIGWKINEEFSSFFSLNPVIHGFYDLYDIPKTSPRSLKLSTIYEMSESDSSSSIPHLRIDAEQHAKIREFAETLIEARKNEKLYYDMGSVMTCINENPFTTLDELFVLGKYKLLFDEGSEGSGLTLKPEIDDWAQPVPKRTDFENKDASRENQQLTDDQKMVSSSTTNLDILKEEVLVDTDLEMFCKQELDKFPKDNLGIRFKQLIKFNGKVLFDCRCNYDELPLKLRRKYEGQEYVLLEFNHLIIPNQRKVYFALHCCRHTIEEILQIMCITGKNTYIQPASIEELVCSYRCAYVKSQLTHATETLPTIMQPKFFASIIDDNSKTKFVQDWLDTSKAVAQTQLEQSSAASSRVSRHFTELSENQEEPFINLQDLEESTNSSSQRFTPRHPYFDERGGDDEDYPEES